MKLRAPPFLVRGLLLLLLLAVASIPRAQGGIYGFWGWYKAQYKEVVVRVNSEQFAEFDHVLIDVNQLTHMAARKARDEEHAIKRLLKEVARTLRVVRPKMSVVIAFDGPAPLAKIITQRKRRSSEKELNTPINSLHLSPGTAFMRRAAEAIMEFCHNRSSSDPRPRRDIRYYISGTECPGEGEMKLMDWINTHAIDRPNESLVVVGGDADLVLQGLALPGLPDFNVYIPDVKRSGYFVSLRQFIGRLEKDFPGQSHHVRNDMVLLLVMAGNDYLKKVRGLTFRNKLQAYTNTKRLPQFQDQFMLIPENRTFNWPFLLAFYDELASRSYVEDINLLNRGPTPAGVLNELMQKKEVEPFFMDFEGEGVSWTVQLRMGDRVFRIDEPMRSMKAAKQAICEMVLKDVAPQQYAKYFPPATEEEEEGDSEDEREQFVDGVGRNEDDDLEEEEEAMYAAAASAKEGGEDAEADADAIVDWRHEEKLFDERHYLTGLLWNVQMYIDGYCPDYQFAYRYRFAPSARCLAEWIRNTTSADPNFRLDVPVSHEPPLHPALACLAVMPRWGLHLVPENLSSVVEASPRVDGMYDVGAPFSLDVLIEAVNAERPDLIRSQHFYWTEIGVAPGNKPLAGAGAKKKGVSASDEEEATAAPMGSLSCARRVEATSAPPLRPWEKDRYTEHHFKSMPHPSKRFKEKRPYPAGPAPYTKPSSSRDGGGSSSSDASSTASTSSLSKGRAAAAAAGKKGAAGKEGAGGGSSKSSSDKAPSPPRKAAVARKPSGDGFGNSAAKKGGGKKKAPGTAAAAASAKKPVAASPSPAEQAAAAAATAAAEKEVATLEGRIEEMVVALEAPLPNAPPSLSASPPAPVGMPSLERRARTQEQTSASAGPPSLLGDVPRIPSPFPDQPGDMDAGDQPRPRGRPRKAPQASALASGWMRPTLAPGRGGGVVAASAAARWAVRGCTAGRFLPCRPLRR